MKTLIIVLALTLMGGCAGRTASPVMPRQYDDKHMSCTDIEEELRTIELDIRALLPKTDKTANRVGFGIAGLFIWPLWFFMDLSEAEKIEIEAYKVRYENLRYLMDKKDCQEVLS